MNEKTAVSAQVMLSAANGAKPDAKTRITSENVREWMPSGETITQVSAALKAMGFTVGNCVGNSLSITGTAGQFADAFHTKIQATEKGGMKFADGGRELPSGKIPAPMRKQIAAITFTAPPDFGPGTTSFQ